MQAVGLTEIDKAIKDDGYCIVPKAVGDDALAILESELLNFAQSSHARIRGGDTYALRNILELLPCVLSIARNETIVEVVRSALGENFRPVKAILFDKTEANNWSLRWHQDSVISVKERKKAPGFHAWTVKVGIPHVRPPVEVFEDMLAARIHLDDCSTENGALKVIPGSHRFGQLNPAEISTWVKENAAISCQAKKGDVLFMRPLILHSSRKAEHPKHRRVLHIEYAGHDLPCGLAWGG